MIRKICIFLVCLFWLQSSETVHPSLDLTILSSFSEEELYWKDVIHAIAKTESRLDSTIVSPCGSFVGYLQISKIMVRDCNQRAGYQKFTYDDRFSKEKSIDIFCDVQKHYNPERDKEKAIRLWNGGIGFSISGTESYYQKVLSNMERN